jgi:phenylalanyl-tRNA synthetase beta chain
MLISHKWLEKYLPDLNKFEPVQIADALTKSIAEVEQIIPIRQELSNIIVGEVIRVEPHSDSDKLSICQVTTDGENKIQIVCGAPNVKEKAKVAVCLPGGKVFDTDGNLLEIKTAKIRGVESNGMICSAKELGLSENHDTILILDNSLNLGEDLTKLIKDNVYEIENKSLTHRSDCFSHKGIAREISAVLSTTFLAETESAESLIYEESADTLNIDVNIGEEFVKRFSALLIDNIKVADSPIWMQSRLSAIGERPINNIVDITNYVMHDVGQPLHAYDFKKLSKQKLIVRKSKAGEKVTTLDGVERTLEGEMIVITDDNSNPNIAGIMGGEASQITEETTSVLLEAANFDMFNIRRTSRVLGLRTEASTRFEKGLDPNITMPAIKNAYTLISDTAYGELVYKPFDYYPTEIVPTKLEIDTALVNRALNLSLTKYEILDILEGLEIFEAGSESNGGSNLNKEAQNYVTLIIPTFRRDLKIKEDIIEEIARIYGYDKIVPKIPDRTITPPADHAYSRLFREISTNLVAHGFTEVKFYSFVGKKEYENANLEIEKTLKISNPIAKELSYFRNSLAPSHLKIIAENQPEYTDQKIFEISRVVEKELTDEKLHRQPWKLGVLINTEKQTVSEAFFELKGVLTMMGHVLNTNFNFENSTEKKFASLFHPYMIADVKIYKTKVGNIGAIHPEIIFNFGIRGHCALLEIDLDELLPHVGKQKAYLRLSSYPKVVRDISFWIPQDVTYKDIENLVSTLDLPLLKKIKLSDSYSSRDDNKRSYTIHLIFQSSEKTLTDEEVSKLTDFITKELEAKLKLSVR